MGIFLLSSKGKDIMGIFADSSRGKIPISVADSQVQCHQPISLEYRGIMRSCALKNKKRIAALPAAIRFLSSGLVRQTPKPFDSTRSRALCSYPSGAKSVRTLLRRPRPSDR